MRRIVFGAFGSFAILVVLAACGGSSGGGVPGNRTASRIAAAAPDATATPSNLTVSTGLGQINGTDDLFTGGVAKEVGDGDYPAGGQGPAGSSFPGPDANIPCLTVMYHGPIPPGYHVHTFVGLYVNGAEIALPDGTGIAAPNHDILYKNWIPNWTQNSYNPQNPSQKGCFYEMHTHDASGIIHIESSNPNNVPRNGTLFTLGDYLALWGIPVNQSMGQFGPFMGTIQIYTSGPFSRGGPGTPEVFSNTYSLYTGDINQIPLYSHEVTWILIGSGNPVGSSLPNFKFYGQW